MPKKSKVNKLARMSDEERARYLQHRADMEEEARRRKHELIAKFIKNKLDKEESYSKINIAKINQEWRYILRRIKCKQMAADIQGMMASFTFLVERKDRLVSTLVNATQDADDQHRRAFQAHTENLSYFITIGSQRLEKLQSEYENQKSAFLEIWDNEEQDITDRQNKAEFKLTLIKYIQNRDFQSYKAQKYIERATIKNDARLEHEEEMRSLCNPKTLEIDMYWEKLKEVYDSYLEQHNPIMAHYQALQEKDEFYQRDITRNELKIQHAAEILCSLQRECTQLSNKMNNRIKRMNDHKDELSQKYWKMKREFKVQRGHGEEALAVLVDHSQNAIQRLQEVKVKLNKITYLASICNKYELEEDKIPKDTEPEKLDIGDLEDDIFDECKEFVKLNKFLLKANRVKVQTMCLKIEKTKLLKENIQLKQYIKRYLTELALKGEKGRPLSVQLQSEMQKIDKPNRPITCIEGALSNAVMHEKRMKLEEKRNKEIGGIRAYPRMNCQ